MSHMVVVAKVCELTDGFLWFVCDLYVGILTSPLTCYTNVISDIKLPHMIRFGFQYLK